MGFFGSLGILDKVRCLVFYQYVLELLGFWRMGLERMDIKFVLFCYVCIDDVLYIVIYLIILNGVWKLWDLCFQEIFKKIVIFVNFYFLVWYVVFKICYYYNNLYVNILCKNMLFVFIVLFYR